MLIELEQSVGRSVFRFLGLLLVLYGTNGFVVTVVVVGGGDGGGDHCEQHFSIFIFAMFEFSWKFNMFLLNRRLCVPLPSAN